MRQDLTRMIAVAAILAAATLATAPARAADTANAAVPPPTALQTFAAPGPAPAPLSQPRMAASVGELSQRIQRDVGAIYPGEDILGAGTSLTH